MPTVPVYGQRKVATEALPAARRQATLTERAAGVGVEEARAGVSREIGQLGGEVANTGFIALDIQQKAKQRADDMAATMADNQLATWMVRRLNDPQSGALNVRGMNAMNLPEQLEAEFGQVADEIGKTLTTQRQREAFELARARRGLSMLETVSQHTSREITRAEGEALNTKIENTKAVVAANASQKETVAWEIDSTAAAIRAHGKNMGWDLDTIESKIADVESMAFSTAVETLVDQGKTPAAKIYFEEVGSRITDPKDRTRLQKMITQQTDLEEGQALADTIIREGGTLTEQREKARKEARPEIRAVVEQRIEHDYQVQKSLEQERVRDQLGRAFDWIHKGGTVNTLPGSLYEDVKAHLPQLDSYQKSREQPGGVQKSDLRAFYTMRDNAMRDPKTFVNTTLEPLQAVLTEHDYRQLKDLQLELKNQTPKAQKMLDGFGSQEAVFSSTMRAYGIDTTKVKAGSAEETALDTVRSQLSRLVDDHNAQPNAKPLTNTEMRDMMNGIMQVHHDTPGSILGGFFFGWAGVPFTNQSKRLIDVTYDEIPAKTKIEIEDTLRARRLPVNPVTVRDFFIEMSLDAAAKTKAP